MASPENSASTTIRRPQGWIAITLSMLSPGVGQIYCGAISRGVLCFCLTLLCLPLVTAAALIDIPSVNLAMIAMGTLLFVSVYVFALADTLRLVRQETTRNFPIAYVTYTAMVFAGLANPLTGAFLVRRSVFTVYYIPTSSMVPTFVSGDYIIANKLFARSKVPQRGELVVFRNPENRRQSYIKRVIALPGDTIEVKGHDVFVNGKKLSRDPLPRESSQAELANHKGETFEEENAGVRYTVLLDLEKASVEFKKQKVPDSKIFVLGDYRTNSKDSRHFSFVPLGDVEGRLQSIILPGDNWQRLGAF